MPNLFNSFPYRQNLYSFTTLVETLYKLAKSQGREELIEEFEDYIVTVTKERREPDTYIVKIKVKERS